MMSKNNKNKKDLLKNNYVLGKKNFPINKVNFLLTKKVNFILKNLSLTEGLGLSSIQAGINIQLYVARLGNLPFSLYNHKYLASFPYTKSNREACLSIPQVNFNGVSRPCNINISFISSWGNHTPCINIMRAAPLFNHEADHLNGTSILDYTLDAFKK